MKRSPLGPGAKALERGSTFPNRGKGLNQTSAKMRQRRSVQQRTKTGGPCQLRSYVLWAVTLAGVDGNRDAPQLLARLKACTNQGSTRHHRRKARDGSDLAENLMLCCPMCNRTVEDYPLPMRAASEWLHETRGWPRIVVRPGDPEYDDLARTAES